MEQSNQSQKKNFLNRFFNMSMIVFLSLMVILVFINATMRYVLNTSLPISEEYARFFFMWTVFLGVIAAFQDKTHVAVTMLTDKLKGKAKVIVYILAQFITLVAFILISIGGLQYTISASTYASVATGVNYGLVVSGFVIMIIGSTAVILMDTFKTLKNMVKGE